MRTPFLLNHLRSILIYLPALSLITSGVSPPPSINNARVKEALAELHKHLDDDHSGTIDTSESKEFRTEELQSEDAGKDSYFHGDDPSISVEDLERAWGANPVRNWTVDDVVSWMSHIVLLPEYSHMFKQHEITGADLPMIAVKPFLRDVLRIVNKQHRKKIELKAMDVILFGSPFDTNGSLLKDGALVISLLAISCLFFYTNKVKSMSKHELNKMMEDMEGLQQAEKELKQLQKRLSSCEDNPFEKPQVDGSEEQLKHAEELQEIRAALAEAHSELAQRSFSTPPELLKWLQLTYHKEKAYHGEKKMKALKELEDAKEGCRKLSKKRGTFFGTLRLAHGHQFGDVDKKIITARESLTKIVQEMHEQQHRWKQIEALCGCRISRSGTPSPIVELRQEVEPSVAERDSTGSIYGTSVARSFGRSASDPENMRIFSNGRPVSASPSQIWMPDSSLAGKKAAGSLKKKQAASPCHSDSESLQKASVSSSSSSLTSTVNSNSPRSGSIMRLQDIGKRNSDSSLSVGSDLVGSLYRTTEYAKDYNSLACVSLPHSLEKQEMSGNLSDSETSRGKKKRHLLWKTKKQVSNQS